jgi:hypothetical protein
MLRYSNHASPKKTLANATPNIAEPSDALRVTLPLRADPPPKIPPKKLLARRAERLFWG